MSDYNIRDSKPKFTTYDNPLNKKAGQAIALVTNIGPGAKGNSFLSRFSQSTAKLFNNLGLQPNSRQNLAYAWRKASKSESGYSFVEFSQDKQEFTTRDVANLNEDLGVEGFENVVTEKRTYSYDENGNYEQTSFEYFDYRTIENEEGEKEVQYRHIKISKGNYYQSEFKTATPDLKKPKDE